jgi:hypothetical protein
VEFSGYLPEGDQIRPDIYASVRLVFLARGAIHQNDAEEEELN